LFKRGLEIFGRHGSGDGLLLIEGFFWFQLKLKLYGSSSAEKFMLPYQRHFFVIFSLVFFHFCV